MYDLEFFCCCDIIHKPQEKNMFLFGNVLYVENIIDYLWISANLAIAPLASPLLRSARSAYALGYASDYEE